MNGVWTFYDVEEFKTDLRTNMPPVPVLQTNVLAMPEFLKAPEQIKSESSLAAALPCPAAAGPRERICR